ncbi:MAG: hypothetical protein IPM84_11375 [Anaerolineae bacterium]|nr:hypothetical protein [Anaerolineae bacterium]
MNTSANGASLPVAVSEIQRNQQAQIVNDFVDAILALDPSANIVALGDFNDFQFSTPLAILKGGVLTDLIRDCRRLSSTAMSTTATPRCSITF